MAAELTDERVKGYSVLPSEYNRVCTLINLVQYTHIDNLNPDCVVHYSRTGFPYDTLSQGRLSYVLLL